MLRRKHRVDTNNSVICKRINTICSQYRNLFIDDWQNQVFSYILLISFIIIVFLICNKNKKALQTFEANICKAFYFPNYLFENCGALLAFLSPYFFLSFIRGSLVRNPAALSAGLLASASTSQSALEIPCLTAPA